MHPYLQKNYSACAWLLPPSRSYFSELKDSLVSGTHLIQPLINSHWAYLLKYHAILLEVPFLKWKPKLNPVTIFYYLHTDQWSWSWSRSKGPCHHHLISAFINILPRVRCHGDPFLVTFWSPPGGKTDRWWIRCFQEFSVSFTWSSKFSSSLYMALFSNTSL